MKNKINQENNKKKKQLKERGLDWIKNTWNKMSRDKIKKNNKKVAIKRMGTKLDTRIKWNKMLRDEIK